MSGFLKSFVIEQDFNFKSLCVCDDLNMQSHFKGFFVFFAAFQHCCQHKILLNDKGF